MILSNYKNIYKNYCISYLGDNFIYPVILSNLRDLLEKKYENLNIYYCYNTKIYDKFKNKKNVISKTFLQENQMFGYVFDLKENFISNSIENLINFEKFDFYFEIKKQISRKCLLIKNSINNSLTDLEITKIKNEMCKKGYEIVEKFNNTKEIGAIAGIESPELFAAAFYGIPTFLFDKKSTSINLYKKMFSNHEILN